MRKSVFGVSNSNLFIFSGLQGKQQEMKYYISKHKLTTRDEVIICIHDKLMAVETCSCSIFLSVLID